MTQVEIESQERVSLSVTLGFDFYVLLQMD